MFIKPYCLEIQRSDGTVYQTPMMVKWYTFSDNVIVWKDIADQWHTEQDVMDYRVLESPFDSLL